MHKIIYSFVVFATGASRDHLIGLGWQVCYYNPHEDTDSDMQYVTMGRVAGAAPAHRIARTLDLIAAHSIVRSNDTVRLEPLALPEIFATMEAR